MHHACNPTLHGCFVGTLEMKSIAERKCNSRGTGSGTPGGPGHLVTGDLACGGRASLVSTKWAQKERRVEASHGDLAEPSEARLQGVEGW